VRYTIAPYLIYKRVQEFDLLDRCIGRARNSEAAYYRCFIFDREKQDLKSRPGESERPLNARKLGAWGKPRSPQ
jgi:hypothetical protein